MQARGALMTEHRLIGRMIAVMRHALEGAEFDRRMIHEKYQVVVQGLE